MASGAIGPKDVDALRKEVESTIEDAVRKLRVLEGTAKQRLGDATTEQQRLRSFLDELRYRLHAVATSTEPLKTITGPLTESQIQAMYGQEDSLKSRDLVLERVNVELDQLSTRLSWLVHQIEGAGDWVLASGDPEGESDAAVTGDSTASQQVMWAQIIMGQEAERARLAREVHDGPAQVLANTVMRLQFVEQMYKHRPEEVKGELAKVRAALQESLRDVRRFMFNLRPASLTDVGLLPTLRQYTRDYSEQFDVPVEFNAPDNLTLSANQELAAFRIVQEALQNIHKHAEAARIEVNIHQRPGGPVVLTIFDDGKGFDVKSARQRRPSSSGLVSMKERAATIGATLKIDSKPGTGTTITLTMQPPKGQ